MLGAAAGKVSIPNVFQAVFYQHAPNGYGVLILPTFCLPENFKNFYCAVEFGHRLCLNKG